MPEPLTFSFDLPFHQVGVIDDHNCVIHGVSIMQGNLTAEGHDLEVDATTLSQVFALARSKEQIAVKLNHGSGIENLNGYIAGNTVWMDLSNPAEPKVRGTWHLLKSHEETPRMLERARKQPRTFGMSASFKGGGERRADGKKAARCSELKAVDCVTDPAANKGGLFGAQEDSSVIHFSVRGVDNPAKAMPEQPASTTPPAAAATQADDTPAWAKTLLEKFEAQEARLAALEGGPQLTEEQLQQRELEQLAQLASMTDEQIAAEGLDVALVRADIQSAIESGHLVSDDGGDGDGAGAGADGDAGGAPAAAGAAAGAPAGASFEARARQIVQFEIGKLRQQARDAAETAQANMAFEVIEQKVEALCGENQKLTTELSAKDARIKALEMTLRTSGLRNPGAAGESNLFQSKTTQEGTFEHVVRTEFDRLVKAGTKEKTAKVLAFEHGIKRHEHLYLEFRERGGRTIELAAK